MFRKILCTLTICLSVMAGSVWAQTNYVLDTGDPDERVCNPKSYTELDNGTVLDNVTGLEWVQDGNLMATRDPSFDKDNNWSAIGDGKVTWQHAIDYIALLNADNYLGFSDWRLPSIEELLIIVDYGSYLPATALPFATLDTFYWSSSLYLPSYADIWVVSFYYGGASGTMSHYDWYVRPVRGQVQGPFDDFVINGDGTVTDNSTQLIWQQCEYGQTWDGLGCTGSAERTGWYEAVAYIQGLNDSTYLGHDDWRLPTVNELQSLVDHTLVMPATQFPGTQIYRYWSSTSQAPYPDITFWTTYFPWGSTGVGSDTYSNNVRAVRGGFCWVDSAECLADSDCDDGVFCNGAEICDNETCISSVDPCTDQLCDEDNNTCVDCLEDTDCAIGYICENDICVSGGFIQIDKCKVKAGKKTYTDSIKLSGWMDATEADFIAAMGGDILVSLETEHISDLTITFPLNSENFNKGKYTSPKSKFISFSFNTVTGKLKVSAKLADFTGVSCPITFRVQLGDYVAETVIEEDVVNGPNKPCPLPLMMNVMDSLNILKQKVKRGSASVTDSVSLSGTFTIDGPFAMPTSAIITIGTDTFTLPQGAFDYGSGKHTCKSFDIANGTVSAKFNTVKAKYSIKIKNATLSDSGPVNFGINIFGNSLWAEEQIILPPDF